MATTKQIQRGEWKRYFDEFVKRHLRPDPAEVASIEVLSPTLGALPEVTEAHLIGLDYDPKSKALEIALHEVDHLVFYPQEIWVIEEDDGFISVVDVVRDDGTEEIVRLQRTGAPAPLHAAP